MSGATEAKADGAVDMETSGGAIKELVDPPQKDLSVKNKLTIGMGGLSVFLGNNSVNALAMPFYNMLLGVPTAMLGMALSIPRIWDAFTDPLMGAISDNYHSKYGRRRPFILLGALLMGLTFGSIWMVPQDWGNEAKIAWFIVTNLLFYTSFTIFSVPYISLTYEASSDYDQRTSVQGYVTFFSKVGELLYQAVIPLSTLLMTYSFASSKTQGIQLVTWVYAVVGMGIAGSIPAIFSREREMVVKPKAEKKERFWKQAATTLKNKPFAMICCLSVMTMFAGMFASCMDYYLLVYYMFEGDLQVGSEYKLWVTIGYAVMGFAGIPFIVWLTKVTTKVQALQFVYILMIINAILRWFIYQPGNTWQILLDPLTGGLFWIGVGTVMQSMIADICDNDELSSGERREGMFGAIFGWATKLAISLSWAFAGVLLEGLGFQADLEAAQSAETFMGMRLSMVCGAAAPAILCLVLMRFYPITKEKMEETRKTLEARRAKGD